MRPLVDSSLEAIGKAHDAALSEVAALETEHAALAAEHLKGDKARRDELRALAAQKAAVVTAKAEHERFLTETGRQVDALERAAAAAAQPIEGRTACIKMVQAELATARKEAERLEIAATAAEEKRLAHAKELELLKSRAKSRASALRVQVESESSIVDEQQRYVDSLAQRANVASEQTPSERELGATRAEFVELAQPLHQVWHQSHHPRKVLLPQHKQLARRARDGRGARPHLQAATEGPVEAHVARGRRGAPVDREAHGRRLKEGGTMGISHRKTI